MVELLYTSMPTAMAYMRIMDSIWRIELVVGISEPGYHNNRDTTAPGKPGKTAG